MNLSKQPVVAYASRPWQGSSRGSSSFALSTEPLFIVGGTEYNSLEEANNAVSVEDIREVEIKKDGSEYGMKGANGAIVVLDLSTVKRFFKDVQYEHQKKGVTQYDLRRTAECDP